MRVWVWARACRILEDNGFCQMQQRALTLRGSGVLERRLGDKVLLLLRELCGVGWRQRGGSRRLWDPRKA